MKFFNIDGPVLSFLNKMADLIILNILFLICCLPVFTIGASVTAMYYVTLRMVRDHEGYIARNFFNSFKENFRQATLIWIPSLLIIIILMLDIRLFSADPGITYQPVIIGAYLLLFLMFFLLTCIFPVLSRFSNTTGQVVKNAFLIGLSNLPYTVCILLIQIIPLVLTAMAPLKYSFIFLLWLLFGFSLIAYVCSFLFEYKLFKKYLPDETPPK